MSSTPSPLPDRPPGVLAARSCIVFTRDYIISYVNNAGPLLNGAQTEVFGTAVGALNVLIRQLPAPNGTVDVMPGVHCRGSEKG